MSNFTFGASVTDTYTSNPGGAMGTSLTGVSIGDLLFATIDPYNMETDCVTAVADSLGNTYSRVIKGDSNAIGELGYIYWCQSAFAGTATLSVTHSGTNPGRAVHGRASVAGGAVVTVDQSNKSIAGTTAAVTLSGVAPGAFLLSATFSNTPVTAASGHTEINNTASWANEQTQYKADAGAGGSITITWGGTVNHTSIAASFKTGGVVISGVSPSTPYNGQAGVVITGVGFGASQGSGHVYISPTNSIADGAKVTQTVTAWSDTSITITAVKGGLSFDTAAYLFVQENGGLSNATGTAIQIQARPNVRENLITETGAVVASVSGITMVVYHAVPTTASPNPVQVIESVATNGSGAIDVRCLRGSLTIGDPIWIALMKDGTPAKGTVRKVTPVYE